MNKEIAKPSYEALEKKIRHLEHEASRRYVAHELEDRAHKNHKRLLRFLPDPVLIRDKHGRIVYLNPAFTQTFGWTYQDLKGQEGRQYVPEEIRGELMARIRALPPDKSVLRMKTRRITKDGRQLTVIIKVGIDRDEENHPAGMIIIFRDVTAEQRNLRTRNAINRISQALPKYPGLASLMQYIILEIQEFLGTEGANVILLDEAEKEFYFLGVAHDNPTTRDRIKKTRFPMDELISGEVVKTGKPIIMTSLPNGHRLHQNRDRKIGHKVKNVMVVPLRVKDRIIGVITADNKKEGEFDKTDLETLNTIAATVALSIENARVSESLKKANEELTGLNAAKDKMLSHLSHELKTPVAIMLSSVKILSKKLSQGKEHPIDPSTLEPVFDRIMRNLNRIVGIEDEISDIVQKKSLSHGPVLSLVLSQCQDLIDALIAEKTGDAQGYPAIREALGNIYSQTALPLDQVVLSGFVRARLEELRPLFAHRDLDIEPRLSPCPPIQIPMDHLGKIVDGLIRNAVENTPDGGKIIIQVRAAGKSAEFMVEDHGIGLTPEARQRIWEGFFTPRETLQYSSKRPFDFGAGGKGADLLRMKIFSEHYRFTIRMASTRCRHLPRDADICPGKKSLCPQGSREACNGRTRVTLRFPFQRTDSDAG